MRSESKSIQISTIHWKRGLFEEWHWSRLPTPQAARRFSIILMADKVESGPAPVRPVAHLGGLHHRYYRAA